MHCDRPKIASRTAGTRVMHIFRRSSDLSAYIAEGQEREYQTVVGERHFLLAHRPTKMCRPTPPQIGAWVRRVRSDICAVICDQRADQRGA